MNQAAWIVLLLCVGFLSPRPAHGEDPTVQDLLSQVGIPPKDGMRGQFDTTGFVTTAAQMDTVLARCTTEAAPRARALAAKYGWTDETAFAAAVCPHDDYYYAGRLYPLVLSHIHAKTVVLFGVFHKARVWNCHDKLVFDSFDTWRGPYGPVKVSPLRAEILSRLPKDDVVVDNDMQQVEHSVEAIVPWLQAYDRDVEIVSILVPYMDWKTMDRLAGELSSTLSDLFKAKGWVLGRDVALVASTDAVHYGDSQWGGSNFAAFGTDAAGYEKAVARDRTMAEEYLCGPIDPKHLEEFLYTCVDRKDVMKYKVTWCGRFSVPFGLDVASRVARSLESRPLEGTFLDYGTSISEASLSQEGVGKLGPTAPNNFHHFVGYAAIGYR